MSTKGRYESGIATTYDSVTTETVGKLAPVVFYDDFTTSSLVVPAGGAAESGMVWTKKIVGAGPPTVGGAAGANGWMECALEGSDQKQDAGLYMNDRLRFSIHQGLIFETKLIVSVIPTLLAEAVWGVCSAWADGPDTITYSAWFTADGSGLIYCETDDDTAVEKSVTSGVTVLNTVGHYYKIDMSDVTSIKFYIDGVRVATTTTFACTATALVQPYLGLYKSTGVAVGTIAIDYVKLWQKRS